MPHLNQLGLDQTNIVTNCMIRIKQSNQLGVFIFQT